MLVDDYDQVRVLTTNNPARRNAWTIPWASELRDALRRAASDEDVRAVVLRGAGEHYSSGADMQAFADVAAGRLRADPRVLGRLDEPLRAFPKPLIAAVDGACVGMAVTTLPFFDLVYATERATFRTPFVRIGLVLEMGSSHTLPRLIGPQRANELILRGAPIDAATACAWGLVTRVVPNAALMDEALACARDIAAGVPDSVRVCKQLMREGAERELGEAIDAELAALAKAYASPAHREAVAAFFRRKRGPKPR